MLVLVDIERRQGQLVESHSNADPAYLDIDKFRNRVDILVSLLPVRKQLA